ncbi:MAG: Chromate resistance protein ChrB [bacterium]
MKWLILVYRLPRSKTTATKVGTWRKLRKLGVFPLQDSVCVLPSSEKTLHSLDWLAAELRELGGDASLWEAEALTESQERDLREYFLEQVNIHYRKIMEEAAKAESIQEIKSLWMRFHRIKDQDHLKSPLSIQAEAACKARAADLAREEEPK